MFDEISKDYGEPNFEKLCALSALVNYLEACGHRIIEPHGCVVAYNERYSTFTASWKNDQRQIETHIVYYWNEGIIASIFGRYCTVHVFPEVQPFSLSGVMPVSEIQFRCGIVSQW